MFLNYDPPGVILGRSSMVTQVTFFTISRLFFLFHLCFLLKADDHIPFRSMPFIALGTWQSLSGIIFISVLAVL
jgi:hypothetical protein